MKTNRAASMPPNMKDIMRDVIDDDNPSITKDIARLSAIPPPGGMVDKTHKDKVEGASGQETTAADIGEKDVEITDSKDPIKASIKITIGSAQQRASYTSHEITV